MGKDYTQLAKQIEEKVGGADNVESLVHCMTRLRFKLHDSTKFDKSGLEQTEGVIKVLIASNQHQVVIGPHVGEVMKSFEQVTGRVFKDDEEQEEGTERVEATPLLSRRRKMYSLEPLISTLM